MRSSKINEKSTRERERERQGDKLNLTTLKKILNISRTRSSEPVSSISTQNSNLATVSNTFTLLEKYGLVVSTSSTNIPRKSLKMSCKQISGSAFRILQTNEGKSEMDGVR